MRRLMMFLLLAIIAKRSNSTTTEDARVSKLIRVWAPLVWLAPGERFLPLGVPEFLDNMHADDNYLRTRSSLHSLLLNESSFLYGRVPAGSVPIYALVKNCLSSVKSTSSSSEKSKSDEASTEIPLSSSAELSTSALGLQQIESNNVPSSIEDFDLSMEKESSQSHFLEDGMDFNALESRVSKSYKLSETKRRRLKIESSKITSRAEKLQQQLHFHVTYWMFYPFSEGKAVCVLDLGFLGSWPIPTFGGMCLGRLKEYGNHVGDWEHVSLYFKGKDYPLAMYVSAHDAGAFYRYDPRSGTFLYESQETRKGIFQKPIFPERVYTSDDSHPILFSARGSHGLWTAPGKHKFVRLPRLYDESGFGTPWPTWRKVELLSAASGDNSMPGWMSFKGKWGNPKSNCHPLAKLGFNICEFVDGPTGIPMKKMNFKC